MKLKQILFALVAMMSFTFSAFAQTVTTEAELRAALESTQSANVVLGNNIELSAQITIPKKTAHTLELNGKKVTGGIYVYGTLTINDGVGTGELTASTYVLNGAGGSKIILNGGKVYRASSWSVYTTGIFTVNGGVVENTIRVAGSGTIELNGGKVTNIQVTSGNLNITDSDATVAGNLSIEKGAKSVNIADGTINGDITIANEATDKVEVSGGTFKDADAIKDYLPSGSALLQKPDGTYEIVAGQFKVGGDYYPTFAAALNAVENGQTIELLENATGDEKSTELTFDKDIKFTITGKAPQYALPVVTFQNAEVTIKDAEILIPELDARQNAVINIVNSTVHDAGGNSIAKSYYNGTINIDKTSTVYMMQITTMGYINVAGTVNATWQTNVYGNGMISLAQGATFNTGALHLTGQDYSGRDNTDTDRVGKPATIVVDGATLNVGSVKSDNGSDYSYNSKEGINVGTVDGKLALLDVKNGGAVNFHMANGQTTNFGAGATVNVAASTLKTISRDENGTVTLANAGVVNVTGASNLNIKNYSGNAINATNTTLADVQFGGAVNAFGTNNISGTSVIGGVLSVGYGTSPTEQVVVNITGNFNGTNVLVGTNNGVDNILNVGKADGERTTVHFGQLGAFADVNVVNADVTYGYAFIRNDFNATNSKFEIKGGVNTYFSGNAKVVLDKTTWALPGYANIGSYGGYMYGNADVTLKNGSSMTATSLGVEVSGEKDVKLTLEDNSSLTATKLTNQGSIVLASTEATLNSNECANVTTSVPNQVVSYIDGKYTLVAAIAQIGDVLYTSLQGAIDAVKNGETITLTDNVAENVTVVQAPDVKFTIDGDGKTMTGAITVDGKSAAYATAGLTIKNVNFVADGIAAEACINLGAKGDSNTRYTSNVTVDSCTFTGTDMAKAGIKNYTGGCKNVTITNSTATGMHSLAQFKTSYGVTLTKNTVTECKNGISVDGSTDVTITECVVDVNGYGIRANGGSDVTVTSNNVKAFTPVVVRSVTANSSFTFNGENTMVADDKTTGKWMVIGDEEYEDGKTLPAESTANVVVALNDANLSYTGIHGAGLAGAGTAEAPYLINNVAELEIFRASVNAGSTKYNAPGLWVALNADIDLANAEWTVGIGDGHNYSFDGNFDGKNYTIKNLNIKPYADADNYICGGLFGYTYGAVTIKNLVIENAKVNFAPAEADKEYHNVGILVGFANNKDGQLNVDNVIVKGDIKVDAPQTYGVAAIVGYSYRNMGAITNTKVLANAGSYINAQRYVGGISGYSYDAAIINNCTVENLTLTGEIGVGGIAGLAKNGNKITQCTVNNVTVNGDKNVAYIVGELQGEGGDVTVADNNAPQPWVGGSWNSGESFVATIGTQYYTSVAKAIEAAKENDVITLIADITASDIITINKAITLDGNRKTLTSTAARAINVSGADGVTIKDLTINASGERAINVIQNATNVTIDNVIATAANYTVNLAGSAAGAVVVVKNSNLTGLNVVNVAAAGSNVTINGGTITCNDQNANENYAALAMNKDAVGAKIAATGVTFDIKGDSKKAKNGAEDGEITIDGKTDEVAVNVAYIKSESDYYYAFTSIEAAIEKANAGQTIVLIRDITASDIITIDKAITLDGNGKKLTSTAGRAINVDCEGDVAIKNLTINAKGERAINVIQKPANVTIENVTATAANYTVNLASSAGAAKVAIKNSTLNGLCTVNVSAAGANVTVDESTVNCNDNNATAGEAYAALCLNKEAVGGSIIATNSTINVTDGSDSMKGRNGAENGTVTINGSTDGVAVMVAVITYEGSDYYHSFSSLEKAIEFAKAGDVVTLIRDITTSAQININKNVAIDGNDKKLTVNAARGFQITGGTVAISDLTIDMPNAAEGNRGINLYNGDTNAALDVTLNNVTINGGKAYAVNIGGGKDNKLTINGSTLTGYAAINVHTSSVNHTIVVDGSTLNGKNHNNYYSFGTVVVDGTNAHSLTITNTTITTENLEGVTSKYDKVVVSANCTLNWDGGEAAVRSILADSKKGKLYYTDLQTAIDDAAEVSGTVQILGNITATKSIAIPAAKKVTIDLNGKTITGTDNGTASYGLININPGAELTINGNGAIKLTATENRGWNAYSSVISNQRGKLTVNGGTIEHLGGTDMAYAIDNLTNTGAQNAEAVINGGTIKSTYRAIRQFLNSTKAQNILTVNGGTIEGGNKSIWMQDANKSANPGALTVAADAAIKGDVYLTVTAGSAKWPVTVAVAAAALQGESKVLTTNVPAGYDLANVNGIYGIYSGAAKIGTTYYETVDAAIKAAKAGETVNILAGTYPVPSMKAGITVEGAVNADGTPAVLLEGTLSGTLDNLTLKNLHIKGGNAQRWAYAKGDLVFENVIFEATSIYALHFDGIAAGTNLTYKNCTIIGWAAMGGSPASCVFDGCTIKGNGTYGLIRTYFDAEIKNCTFDVSNVNTNDAYQDGIHAVEGAEVVVNGCTNANGTMKDLVNVHASSVVTVDGVVYKNVAKVGDKNYITIEDAFAAWADGTTLTLLTDIALDTKTLVTECDGYASIVNVEGKAITIDLNGKTITVNASAADLANAKSRMLMAVFSVDDGGKLTIDDSSEDKTGAVNVSANGATVYSLASAYGKDAKLTINNGSYCIDEMFGATSLIYAQHSESVIINGGTYNVGNVGTGANGSPWIFNTKGQNMDGIYVYGGTYPTDINHQFWFNEAIVPDTLALKDNGDRTWTVVKAAAYTSEIGRSTGSWRRNVGYATIEEAIAATQMYNCEGNVVTLAKNVEIEQMITVANGVEVTLDLNGKTLAATDNTSKNYSAIDNRGDLTIVDSSEGENEPGTGKITVTATVNSGWNRYSAVIANNPGGELTVMSGTIEHLGGTDMAYGIDNLTNGKGTHAVTEIYGGTVKSPYRAVRQFLNGVEANNTLAVYGGTLEGANKSIFFHDPSTKANTGTLYVGEEAALKGDVYLFVTENSTEWPVEVEIATEALKDEDGNATGTVTYKNVPATYFVTEYPTAWIVECSELAELTINEADYAETGYINLVQKNVAELTYVREFTGEWETIYLPFDLPVADLMEDFEFAYIYNASNKSKEINIDYVVVDDENFVLMANYPYLIKAKEDGKKEIVVKTILKKTTEQQTIDCSTVLEKFTFVGNYAANYAPEASAYKKYYEMVGGEWTSLDALNPFRFYFQMEKRNGSAFADDASLSIRMRSVDADGNSTDINDVNADQKVDMIFDLHGRRILEPIKGQMYIINGKKVLF